MTEKEILEKVSQSIDEEMCNMITDAINEKIKAIGAMPYILKPDRLREIIKHGLAYEDMIKSINEQLKGQGLIKENN